LTLTAINFVLLTGRRSEIPLVRVGVRAGHIFRCVVLPVETGLTWLTCFVVYEAHGVFLQLTALIELNSVHSICKGKVLFVYFLSFILTLVVIKRL